MNELSLHQQLHSEIDQSEAERLADLIATQSRGGVDQVPYVTVPEHPQETANRFYAERTLAKDKATIAARVVSEGRPGGRPHLELVPGGLGEVATVITKAEVPELREQNHGFLDQHGVKTEVNGRATIKVSRDQEALTCALLGALEAAAFHRYPGLEEHIAKPHMDDAVSPFLEATRKGWARVSFCDGKLALGYVSPKINGVVNPPGEIYVENRNGSENNGLRDAPKDILETALASYDLADLTRRVAEPLRLEKARGHESRGIMIPGDKGIPAQVENYKMTRGEM